MCSRAIDAMAARRMWGDLGLDTTLDQLARPDRRETVRLSDRALVLVANRLTAPASEHALAQWLESDFGCDRCGRRFIAAWRDVVRATVSKGVKREYVRVVEAYRDRDGKTRHRTVINLGRRDVLAEHLDLGKLRHLLHGDAAGDDRVAHKDIGAVGAWDWGPLL
jgi:hypothetical protein